MGYSSPTGLARINDQGILSFIVKYLETSFTGIAETGPSFSVKAISTSLLTETQPCWRDRELRWKWDTSMKEKESYGKDKKEKRRGREGGRWEGQRKEPSPGKRADADWLIKMIKVITIGSNSRMI